MIYDLGQLDPQFYLGLAIELDHVFDSKWLRNELNQQKFLSSVDEVTWFKQSVVLNNDITQILKNLSKGSLRQCPYKKANRY